MMLSYSANGIGSHRVAINILNFKRVLGYESDGWQIATFGRELMDSNAHVVSRQVVPMAPRDPPLCLWPGWH
jgi:hypothetical protein